MKITNALVIGLEVLHCYKYKCYTYWIVNIKECFTKYILSDKFEMLSKVIWYHNKFYYLRVVMLSNLITSTVRLLVSMFRVKHQIIRFNYVDTTNLVINKVLWVRSITSIWYHIISYNKEVLIKEIMFTIVYEYYFFS